MFFDEEILTDRALASYDNPQCLSVSEFNADLDRFLQIKKLFNRYLDGGVYEVNERLLLNHLIVCFNVFGNETLNLLFYRLDMEHWSLLVPYLIFLDRITSDYLIFGEIPIQDIQLNTEIIAQLRAL